MPSPLVFLGIAVLVIALADYAPTIVNGVLVLILAGVVLGHSDTWVTWLQALGGPAPQKGK